MKQAFLMFVALVLSACSVFKSQPLSHSPTNDGISYFLPIGRVHFVLDHKVSGATDISASEVIVPDTSQSYYAKYENDPLSKDNVQVSLKNGLLEQVTSTTEDQTGTVAKNLATTAKQVFEIAAVGVGGAADVTDLRIDATFDPFSPPEVTAIEDKLKLIGGSLMTPACGEASGPAPEMPGFYYRPAYPYALTIIFQGGPTLASPKTGTYNPTPAGVAEFLLNLPSKCSPILSLAPSRTLFGKNVTTIDFADGSLKQINVNKDSEIAGFSQIPVDVTSEILTIPQDLLTLRYKNMSAQDQLVQEQTTLLNDQAKLIAAQQNLNAAQAAALGPQQTKHSNPPASGKPNTTIGAPVQTN